ncbi:MAG: hypothetical protein J3K34DRAFT_424312 [Monoraphidium minutum]|nr:MAG: hypothetical protein J3K34DRAFT_424312 [Monoraphidium minutum]
MAARRRGMAAHVKARLRSCKATCDTQPMHSACVRARVVRCSRAHAPPSRRSTPTATSAPCPSLPCLAPPHHPLHPRPHICTCAHTGAAVRRRFPAAAGPIPGQVPRPRGAACSLQAGARGDPRKPGPQHRVGAGAPRHVPLCRRLCQHGGARGGARRGGGGARRGGAHDRKGGVDAAAAGRGARDCAGLRIARRRARARTLACGGSARARSLASRRPPTPARLMRGTLAAGPRHGASKVRPQTPVTPFWLLSFQRARMPSVTVP